MIDYPRIPKPHIRKRLLECRFYARAFFKLSRDLEEIPPPFKLKLTNSVISGKGKLKEDPIFQNELEWVKKRVTEAPVLPEEALAEESDEQECQEAGGGIECGCCFSSYPFVRAYVLLRHGSAIIALTLSYPEQHGSMPRRPSILQILHDVLLIHPSGRAQSQHRLYGPIWL